MRVFDPSYSPKYLIADCAQAITNGFENVFGVDYTRIHCWFHVLKNIDKRLKSILAPSKSKVLADIRILQLSRTKEEFDCACALFVTKWNECSELQEFIQYFVAEYIEANPNWFAGSAVGFPKTNNGVEGTNNWIKTNSTLRQKLPLNQFLSTASNLVKDWSIERNF